MTKARDLANIISGGFTEADIPNLSASKITTGTFADARIASSNVSQHATSFDDNKIVNDISTLGLRIHSQENLSSSQSDSASFDVFQDDTGISAVSNTLRNVNEYVSTVGDFAFTTDTAGTLDTNLNNIHNFDNNPNDAKGSMVLTNSTVAPTYSTSIKKFGTHSVVSTADNQGFSLNWNNQGYANFSGNEATSMSCWFYQTADNNVWNMIYDGISATNNNGFIFAGRADSRDYPAMMENSAWHYGSGSPSLVLNSWQHLVFLITTSSKQIYLNGSRVLNQSGSFSWNSADASHRLFHRYNNSGSLSLNGHIDQLAFWKNKTLSTTEIADLYNSGNGNDYAQGVNATGNFTSHIISAVGNRSKVGAVITYQDQAGTNALNTDIVLQVSADNGSNYSTATLTALPDFATGIKMAKVNDLSVTAGTQLKYKISFANQSGSKEARIRGVSLQY